MQPAERDSKPTGLKGQIEGLTLRLLQLSWRVADLPKTMVVALGDCESLPSEKLHRLQRCLWLLSTGSATSVSVLVLREDIRIGAGGGDVPRS